MLGRIDRGDFQAIAHRAVGRAAAPLAQDRRILAAGEIDNVLDREKIARQVELPDQLQFPRKRCAHPGRHAIWVTPRRALPGLRGQPALGIMPVGIGFERIFVAQLVKAEAANIGNRACSGNGVRPVGEKPRHFVRRFQVALGIGAEQQPGIGDGGLVPDRGHHVLQGAAIGDVIMDIIGGKDA